MFSISVIICTRNPREDYFCRVLDGLRTQTLPKDQWELLLVGIPEDGRFDLSWHPNVRSVREERIGLAQARMTGTVAAKSDLLVFVNDDNILRLDYLEVALKLSRQNNPKLGAYAGSCILEFEIEPPPKLRLHLAGLLIERRTKSYWSNVPRVGDALPPPAGLVVRKEQALYYRKQALNHPLRGSLGPHNRPPRGCDDSDLVLSGLDLGFYYGMFPELELTHLIPARKLNLKSLETSHESFSYGGRMLEAIHDPEARGLSAIDRMFGRSRPTRLNMYLQQIYMLLTGSSYVERRIRLAQDRGSLRALHDLGQLGYKMNDDGITFSVVGRSQLPFQS